MTKFSTIDGKESPNKTIFKKYIDSDFTIKEGAILPSDWDNVMFIGHDVIYGDVFKAWDDDKNSFTIYFGKKGDEFEL